MQAKVLVLGGNFGGLIAALSVKHTLQDDVDVTVLAADDYFLFSPSLIWVPFGKRTPGEITFRLAPTFAAHGVEFVHAAATAIDPMHKRVTAADDRDYPYDYLVVATGYRNHLEVVPGLHPDNGVHTITTLCDAVEAGEAYRRFLEEPGPVLVAAAQGAGCFGAAYEFLFNLAYRLKRAGLRDRAPLTYVTAEPFLGHFGLGGLPGGERLLRMFLHKEGITAVTGVALAEAAGGRLLLEDGRKLGFTYAVVIPPFLGREVVARTPGLADEHGFVPVRDTYQSAGHPDIYAVGVAAAVQTPWLTPIPVGVPKTGLPTEVQAHVAADNIVARIRGEEPVRHQGFGEIPAVCVMDAGDNGVMILADHMLPPRRAGVLIPGPQAHAAKLAFEKYFLWKARLGYVGLP